MELVGDFGDGCADNCLLDVLSTVEVLDGSCVLWTMSLPGPMR